VPVATSVKEAPSKTVQVASTSPSQLSSKEAANSTSAKQLYPTAILPKLASYVS